MCMRSSLIPRLLFMQACNYKVRWEPIEKILTSIT